MEDLEPILSKEVLEPNSSFEKPYTGTVKYLCFAVPTDYWRPINRIRDVENGFYIDNNTFAPQTLPYTLPDGTVINYTLYVQDIICTVNNFIMLVGNDKQLCAVDDDSNDIAYYVFDINYNYATKKFEKPEFIKIVYKRDGCKHANEVMGW